MRVANELDKYGLPPYRERKGARATDFTATNPAIARRYLPARGGAHHG